MKKTIRRCALSLGLALLFSALPGYAAESGAYVTGLDDVWYILTEDSLLPVDSPNPFARVESAEGLLAEPETPRAYSGQGSIRLEWPAVEGAETYYIYRGTPRIKGEELGYCFAAGSDFVSQPLHFYDMAPTAGAVTVYSIEARDKENKVLSTQKVKVTPPKDSRPGEVKTMGLSLREAGIVDGKLEFRVLPQSGLPHNIFVTVTTRSGRTLFGTMPENILVETEGDVVRVGFSRGLLAGNYTAHITVNVWGSGVNYTNPYTMLQADYPFSIKASSGN